MMGQTILRRGRRSLQRMALDPKARSAGLVLFFGGSGFLLSAAGLTGWPQPLAMGMICATTGWRALVMSLGAMVGYPVFWGSGGNLGIVWSAAGGLLALLLILWKVTNLFLILLPFYIFGINMLLKRSWKFSLIFAIVFSAFIIGLFYFGFTIQFNV